jgi:hypothetical protein
LNDIGRNCLLGNRKKTAKFFNEDFYFPLYLPLWLQDILCVADREGERVVCVGAGLEHPQLSGAQFTDIAHLGRTFAIGQQGQKYNDDI